MNSTFDQLIADAIEKFHEGWDFSYIADRRHSENPPWAYGDTVLTKLDGVETMLDIDTGGGEFLLSMHERADRWPQDVTAIEGYAPNVSVARRNLAPINVDVIEANAEEPLPFSDAQFDLVINRHGAFTAPELMRILKPGRKFITQQVGSEMNKGLNELLNAPVANYDAWTLEKATNQLAAVGFDILEQKDHRGTVRFDDIGAIVWYLRVISWQIPDFSVERYEERLREIHDHIEANGPVEVMNHIFYIEARKRT